ncbi:MAG: DUF3987 domain-containing protein [Gemmataceae bacterium]
MNTPPTLLPHHLADLRRSGLTDDHVRRCGFYSESDPAVVAKLLRRADRMLANAITPCLCLPFFAPDGRPLGYVRCKPDRPRADAKGKPVKYESPAGAPNRAYFPPATRAALADAAVPLLVTEGEKKAARADQDGFACVGLVGVYGWQKKRDGGGPRELIPDLAAVAWAGRPVFVVYDSDLADKPAVRLAEWHLAEALAAAGAVVRAVRLPHGPGGEKAGLDDFLTARGADALRLLMDVAGPVTPPAAEGPAARRFAVGDRVTPADRDNVGIVTAALPGDTYRVRFDGKGASAEKAFPAAQLRPWPPRHAGAGPAAPPRPFVPFPVDALPAPLVPFVTGVAAAIPCDPAAVALPALAVCGAAVGAARVLQIKRSWAEPPIVWAALVARSGSVKSPPFELAVGPFQRLDLDLRAAGNDAARAYRVALDEWKDAERERRARRGDGADPPPAGDGPGEAPPKPRCVAGDITIESLAVILADNPKGVLVYRDELASWFTGLTRYSKTDATADWLQLFHARPLSVDRKTGDKLTIAVPHAAAGVIGTIQPAVLSRAFTREFRASGGAARILVVMPPPRQKVWTDDDLPADVADGYDALVRRLRELVPAAGADGRPVPVPVRFTPEARRRWGRFVDEWGQTTFDAGEESDDLAAAFSKMEGYAARLALIHHLVMRAAPGGVGLPDEVGLDSLEAGVALARWFAAETERVYAALAEDDSTSRLRAVADRVRALGGRATVRALQKSNSRKYRTAAAAEAALAELVAAGWGAWEEARPAGGGHPLRTFVLGPTHDTSDTRDPADEDGEAEASDTRPDTPEETTDLPGDSGRVSEVSCVAVTKPAPGDRPHSEGAAGASVGRGRRRYRSDDRPHERRG